MPSTRNTAFCQNNEWDSADEFSDEETYPEEKKLYNDAEITARLALKSSTTRKSMGRDIGGARSVPLLTKSCWGLAPPREKLTFVDELDRYLHAHGIRHLLSSLRKLGVQEPADLSLVVPAEDLPCICERDVLSLRGAALSV